MDTDSQSLREKIASWSAAHAADFPVEVQQLFARKTEEVLQSGILASCVQKGDDAPDFSLPASDGSLVQLREKLESGPAIVSFYRGTWCPYCTIEFQELLATMPQYRSRGAVVLAVSPQIQERFDPPAESGFEDLSDRGNEVARDYGLVFPLGDEIRKTYEAFGIRMDQLNEDDSYEVPLPATFVIDTDRKIRYAHASADPSERAEPQSLVEVLSSLS